MRTRTYFCKYNEKHLPKDKCFFTMSESDFTRTDLSRPFHEQYYFSRTFILFNGDCPQYAISLIGTEKCTNETYSITGSEL